MNRTRVLEIIAIVLALSGVDPSKAGALEEALTKHPDAARAAHYRENASEIEALRLKTAGGATSARLAAVDELLVRFPDAAVTSAIALISDADVDVAKNAAELVASSIVMSDHDHEHERQLTANQRYVRMRHEQGREALREALTDSRPEVRTVAARMLASLSDTRAIQTIDAGVAQGLYTPVEAVNYFGLARSNVGAAYVERYLQSDSAEARAGAVTYLAANPAFQPRVRDEILLNSAADPTTRAAAAKALGVHDHEFSSYALPLDRGSRTST